MVEPSTIYGLRYFVVELIIEYYAQRLDPIDAVIGRYLGISVEGFDIFNLIIDQYFQICKILIKKYWYQ